MRRGKMKMVMVWIALVMIMVLPPAAMAAEPVTIEGEVNDSYQIVSGDGQVYEVADTAPGNELVENHIGEKVKVTGTLETDQNLKIITVTTFQTLAE